MEQKRLKTVKSAIYQHFRAIRDEEAAGSNPVIPTILNHWMCEWEKRVKDAG
ncbi:MAG: hypothetical protein K5768_00670 [Firmicutes bacterium]|nr:hypothetical protein [Bacillota bacterium]